MTDTNQNYTFLLLGKTGSGKSATGNSILGKKHFKCSDKSCSITKETSAESVTRNGYKVTVIDSPGVMDTSVNSDGAKTKSCTEMTAAMSSCPTDGRIAIVLVLRYGERFTEENRLTLYILKNIFGDQNLWKSCVIVMTHGDMFEINNEDEDVTFDIWLKDQDAELGVLFHECSYRCILFNNRTKSEEEKERQFEQLIEVTKQLDQDYTMSKFLEAKKRQSRLMLEVSLPDIIKKYNKIIGSFMHSGSQVDHLGAKYDNFIMSVDELLVELDVLDNPDKIYYSKDEPHLLDEQRSDLKTLKMEVEIKVTLSQLNERVRVLKNRAHPYSSDWRNSVTEVEISLNSMHEKCDNLPENVLELLKYKDKCASLQEKIKEMQLQIRRHDIVTSYTESISQIKKEIESLPGSTGLEHFPPYLFKVDKLTSEMSALQLEIGGLEMIFYQLNELTRYIHYKMKDTSVANGWKMTSWITGAFSIGTVLIPGVGIPLTIGLNAIPLIGRAIHRKLLERSVHSNTRPDN